MYQPTVFYVKLHLQFGGDIHEISVPAYGGAEPTVTDLMNVIERDYRVPRVLQNLVFQGQDLHTRTNEPLSRFGIRNGVTVRLVGRMAPPNLIPQINNQYNTNSYEQPNTIATFHTSEQSLPYYSQQPQYTQSSTVSTQYDPPPATPTNKSQPPPTPNQEQTSRDEQKTPATPHSTNTK